MHGTGNVVFRDTNESIDIYLPIHMDPATINYHLSPHFIEYCGIIDSKYQQLVLPLLSLPFASIDDQLEKYDLDSPHQHRSQE